MNRIFRERLKQTVALGLVCLVLLWGCSRNREELAPYFIQEKYGVTGAYSDRIAVSDGAIEATVVPVTMADGQKAHLIIPRQRTGSSIYLRDQGGMHPVVLSDRTLSRDEFVRSNPTIVERRPVTATKKKRSWEKEVLIVAGSAGAGAAIGAAAGGKKGAGIGALSGGIAGLIYDTATRK